MPSGNAAVETHGESAARTSWSKDKLLESANATSHDLRRTRRRPGTADVPDHSLFISRDADRAALGVILLEIRVFGRCSLVLCFFNSASSGCCRAEFLDILVLCTSEPDGAVLVSVCARLNLEELRKGSGKLLAAGACGRRFRGLRHVNVSVGEAPGGRTCAPPRDAAGYSNTRERNAFSRAMLPRADRGVILLVASVAAIVLTLRQLTGGSAGHRMQVAARRGPVESSSWPRERP